VRAVSLIVLFISPTLLSSLGSPGRAVVFLHGILGTGKNWRSPAKKLQSLFPHYQALLVDHRVSGSMS
jgi:pimeloyl-ACP methyl ester carboxylesterase